MIIFFGLGKKFIGGFDLLQEKCQTCSEGKLGVFLWARYFHIFWIPVFPIGKFAFIQCQHCKGGLNEHEMSQEQRAVVNEIKAANKYPKICFIGLILIVAGAGFMFLMSLIGRIF